MGFMDSNITQLSQEVGEKIIGRTGGAVSLAVGMAQIFSNIPGLTRLMSYWYHFAIMFEALFILTTIDAGTRIGRFVLQESLGRIYKPFARTTWLPGNLVTSALMVIAWGYFYLYRQRIDDLADVRNGQSIAGRRCTDCRTSFIINRGRAKYAWVTLIPLAFVTITTLTAGAENILNIYYPSSSANRHVCRDPSIWALQLLL